MAIAETSVVRKRILDVARRRFYAEGIRAVSADQLISDAAVAKVTFYRHFRTKDILVEAYLAGVAQQERTLVTEQRLRHAERPAAVLAWYAVSLGALSCEAGFRGCPFINAAAEYPNPEHPARRIVQAHRTWLHSQAQELVSQLGVADPEQTADVLMMLRDGAMTSAYLGGKANQVAARLLGAGHAVLLQAGANPAEIDLAK